VFYDYVLSVFKYVQNGLSTGNFSIDIT